MPESFSELEFALARTVMFGVEMRRAQNAYFRTRNRAALITSKEAEKAFDDAAQIVLEPFQIKNCEAE